MGAFSGFAQSGVLGSFSDAMSRMKSKRKTSKTSSAPATEGHQAEPGSFKRGGKVRKTGYAKVHKGERVLTKAQQRKRMRGK